MYKATKMKLFILLAAIITYVYGANLQCWSVDDITNALITSTDTNADGIIEMDELFAELATGWNLSNDSCVNYHDFITNWNLNFHDHHDTTHAFFKNLDVNHDNRLCEMDVAAHMLQYDNSPQDGMIQPGEMSAFMHAVHPDSHQNNPHGNGC